MHRQKLQSGRTAITLIAADVLFLSSKESRYRELLRFLSLRELLLHSSEVFRFLHVEATTRCNVMSLPHRDKVLLRLYVNAIALLLG